MALSAQLVHERLQESARRMRLSRSSRFLLFGFATSLFVLVSALLLDAHYHFGPLGRWLGFCLILLPLAVTIALSIHAWLAPISEASIARRIEGATAGSRNVLISAIQFDRELPPGSSMRKALFSEMTDPFPAVQWKQVFDLRLLQKLGAALGAVAVALVVWAIISPAHFTNSAARLFLPASRIAPLTRTQIVSIDPGDTQVIHGGDLTVNAKLAGEVPPDAWVSYREAGSTWQKAPMNREVGQPVFMYHWKEVSQPMELYVSAGDTQSILYHVQVRPKTAIASRIAEIEPPAYTKLPNTTVTDFTVLQKIVPGSKVKVKLAFNYALTELTPATDVGAHFAAENIDGKQWHLSSTVAVNETVKLAYRDTDDHADSESVQITVKPDEVPKIQITEPVEGRQLIAEKNATVDLTFTCTDDYGLASVALYRSTDSAQTGDLVQEWKDVAGQRTFTTNTKIDLGKFKAGENGRFSFVLVAKDQNDFSGPGVTMSRPIVIETQTAEQVKQQTETAAAKLQKSIEDLIKLQQLNLSETRDVAKLSVASAPTILPVLNRQVEIAALGQQLTVKTEGLAPALRVMLQSLTQNEMKEAVLALRNASDAEVVPRAKFLDRAVQMEQTILARLQGTPDMVKAGVQTEQLKNILSGLEDLLRNQRELYRDTKPASEALAASLSGRQDTLADQAVTVRDGLAKSAQNAPLADRDFTSRLVKAAGMFGDLKIYEGMLSAADQLQSKKIAEAATTQEKVIDSLVKVITMLNEARLANAIAEIAKLKDTLDGMKEKLSKLETIQRDVLEKTKDQAHKDEFDAKDVATAKEIKGNQDLMSKVIEQMMTDAHALPDLKAANEMRSELVSIFEDLVQSDKKDAENGKIKPTELPVQKEDGLLQALEKAKKIADDMEMWLPTANDAMKVLLENFDTHEMPAVPMLPLKDFFEDIVGKMLEEQKGLFDKANDAASNQLVAENEGNGNKIMDGPQGGFGAQGKSGNQAPNKNEQTGRSSGGRKGESTGEMAGDTAKNLEGSDIDARRTKDPMQKGHVKDEDGPSEAKATGGGKAGGFSDRQGMDGNAPLRPSSAAPMLAANALAVEQELLKQKAAKTYAQATLLYLKASGMSDVVQLMDDSERALKEGRTRDFTAIHQKIVQRLTSLKGNIASSDVVALPAGDSVHVADKQMAAGDEGAVPSQYKDLMADYYRSLTQEK